ncbi:hypothetical protein Scep_015668 [Stephania cephalantha]|uniref:DUF4005 domain-containing protein n=1 Tax=Stephania cephalantha TaxID=152367 RepID=A0AAP0J390_9MAGN
MGKKGNWFGAVKKAFSHENKEKTNQKTGKSKKKWKFGKDRRCDEDPTTVNVVPEPRSPPSEEVKYAEAVDKQTNHAYSEALASTVAEEAAVTAAEAAAEVVRLTNAARYSGKSVEEVAAIKIQTAFRGYLARRALRALRGLVRLKTLLHGQSVNRQVTSTLRSMQTLAHVQSQIRTRRIRMLEENQALQRQIQQECDNELDRLRMGEEWDDSLQSKEQIEAKILNKQEAAVRRERALAYAFSHQQTLRNSSRSASLTFMDPKNPHWGWSWLERWMAARPWENRGLTEKETNDHASVKSSVHSTGGGEISKAYARRELNAGRSSPAPQKLSRPANRKSPSTPTSKPLSLSSGTNKLKSPRGGRWTHDDDSRSTLSIQSEQYRRHSIAGSSIRDDESLASSPAVPSYMASTKSTKAKARLPSPLGLETNETPERTSFGSAKKRLQFPASPSRPRRHSGPPKVDTSSIKDIDVHT